MRIQKPIHTRNEASIIDRSGNYLVSNIYLDLTPYTILICCPDLPPETVKVTEKPVLSITFKTSIPKQIRVKY